MIIGWGTLGLLCLFWFPIALVLEWGLPKTIGQSFGRFAIKTGFKIYLTILSWFCSCHIDISELDKVASNKKQIIIANHPSLLDAVLLLSVFSNSTCVMKDKLMNNFLLGSAARLAGFIPNTSSLQTILKARNELHNNSNLIIFPEGSRTTDVTVFHCHPGVALIAKNAQVNIQTVILDFSPCYLGKNWPWYQPPNLPLYITARLGKTISYEQETSEIRKEIEQYFIQTLTPTTNQT